MKITSALFLLTATSAVSWGACPAGTTADQLIARTPWAFQVTAGDYGISGSAAVGVFRATAPGVLQITETFANGINVSRQQQASGRYIVYADCSGGELMFMANGFAAQLEFVYQSNFEEMYLVTDELNPRYGGTSVLTGEARRTTTGCPAGLGDPLNILNSTTWSFRTFPAYYANSSGASSVGTLNAFNLGTGRLTGTETINYGSFGPIVRGAQIGGRYIINSDCSGGELIITNRGNPAPSLQLEFVFAGPNYKQIYMLNDSLTSLPAINFTTKVDKKADSTQEFEIYPYPMYGDSYTVIAGVAKQQ